MAVFIFQEGPTRMSSGTKVDLIDKLQRKRQDDRMTTTNAIADELSKRKSRVEKMCRRVKSISGKTTELSGIRSANFSYCVVPKAGCTMWIRIFKFLAGQESKSGNPMTITKFMTHYKETMFLPQFSLPKDASFVRHSLRTMTVRDPYTRLWSAYIDKLLLPDFWFSKGIKIIEQIREDPKERSLDCGYDVTFPEMIEYVINTGHDFRYWNQDKHWLPASDICDPCIFKPAIIGKQETFMADLSYTLKQLKLDYLIPKIKSVDHYDFEIKDEIDYVFEIYPAFEHCIDKNELCKRLWTAFIFNGYLPAEEPFPTNIYTDSLNKDSFYELVKVARIKYNSTHAEVRERRRHALSVAYQQIPDNHIRKLQMLYKNDFQLFNYDPNPDYLRTK